MIALWIALAVARQDPAERGPSPIVVETRHYRDDARNRPLRTEIWRPAARGELPGQPIRSPVILFSHGFAGTRLQSRFLCSHLASHGYVVAACDHAGNTFLDLNVFKASQSSMDRPHDLRVVLDKLLEESSDSSSALFGRLDGNRCAAIGHSFGGYTALATVGAWLDLRGRKERGEAKPSDPDYIDFEDRRFVAAVALTPVMKPFLTPESVRMVRKPVLLIGGSHDAQTSPRLHQRPLFESLPGLRYLGVIQGATHFNFVDQGFIDSSPMLVRMMHRPRIDRRDADALILRQTTAFLERHVRGSNRFDHWLAAEQRDLEWRVAVGPASGGP
jgi:predicted dienelactone hydrolase